jgi:hypothetical protein
MRRALIGALGLAIGLLILTGGPVIGSTLFTAH